MTSVNKKLNSQNKQNPHSDAEMTETANRFNLLLKSTVHKSILFYIIAFILMAIVLLFFNRGYREFTLYSDITGRQNTIYEGFQGLAKQVNNAAIQNPDLAKAINAKNIDNLFFADSSMIINQLNQLKLIVTDSVNVKVTKKLDILIHAELSWLLKSNVPDSIVHHRALNHIAAFEQINSLINTGIQRTFFLIHFRKQQLNKEIRKIRIWMTVFILLSVSLLTYTTVNLFRHQSKIKRKEKELDIVLNRISDGVVSVDNEWRYTFLNDAALSAHPLGKEKTLGKIIWDLHPGMKETIFWDTYHEAMHTKKVVEVESFYAPMDVWFSVKIYPSSDGLTIFYKNITENKKSELVLSQTLKEITDYKYALDESSIVAITNQKGIINYVNDNFCKISGYTKDELIGMDHRIINSGFHSKEFIRNIWVTIAGGKTWRGELKNKAKNGSIYWVDTTIVPFLNEQGKPYQYVAIRADITHRKQAEDEIKILNEGLEKRVNERTEELLNANKELGQFAYVASHDLQEPLRTVANYMKVIEEDYTEILDENAHDYIQSITQSIKRMSVLIKSLLDFSRLGHNKILTTVDCEKIIKDVIEDLKDIIKTSNAIIELNNMPCLNVYETEMRQVFQNLITNAIKFRRKDTIPVVKISSEEITNAWKFSVSDNGIGIDSIHYGKIFDIFQRLENNEKYEGSGIGLANCKKIIQLHKGEIWVEPNSGQGSIFHFTIPNLT